MPASKTIEKMHFDMLHEEVVAANTCVGCGNCVVTCPVRVLELEAGKPRLVGKCIVCGVCHSSCPVFRTSLDELEEFVFGRKRTEDLEFGTYQDICIARTQDEEILKVCQDGGIVSTLLTAGIEAGLLDGAVVSGVHKEFPHLPTAKVATTRNEILDCAGSRYFRSPNMLALREVAKLKLEKVALVGTPCHVVAARKLQMVPIRKHSKSLALIIGLFCMEVFRYDEAARKLKDTLDITLGNVAKMNIKGKFFRVYDKLGNQHKIRLKEMKLLAEAGCSSCGTFAADLADISVGAAGLSGLNVVIIRTDTGRRFWQTLLEKQLVELEPLEHFTPNVKLVGRLSASKASAK